MAGKVLIGVSGWRYTPWRGHFYPTGLAQWRELQHASRAFNSLARDSPSTQRTASMMLDLPQPLGPTTPTSWPGNMKLVGSAKDLNPDNLMELRRTALPDDAD